MDIAKDIVDKYSTEQIVAYLDSLVAGVLQNYKTSLKANQPQITWGSIGDIAQVRSILHEMKKRDEAKKALAGK